jgi:hypothetical protein
MSGVEIKRPGSDKWESGAELGGTVKLADTVGALVRYPTGDAFLVTKVVGLSEPDASGTRHLQMEMYTGE